MTEHAPDGTVPEWDLADRMRKALRQSGLGVQEMADYLGVARTSVSNWINGRIEPSVQTLRLWSLRCGVSYDWLRTGRSPHLAPEPISTGHLVRKPGRCAVVHTRLRVAA